MQSYPSQFLDLYPDGLTQGLLLSEHLEKEILSFAKDAHSYTLLATGGLGRKEQGIYSDVDLLFISESKAGEEDAMTLLKKLWDAQYQVGYSIRTLKNVFEYAREDMEFFTTILFSRYLLGDLKLFHKYQGQKRTFFHKNRGLFFQGLYSEIKHLAYSEKALTILSNQPKLKNSFGGLRGFQYFKWFIHLYPEYEFIMDHPAYKRALSAYAHLWAVRNEASITAGRSIDCLTLDILEKILQNRGKKSRFQAEKYLKEIYYSASAIFDLLLELREHIHKNLPLQPKFFKFFRKKSPHANLTIVNKEVYIKENTTSAFLDGILYAVRSGLAVGEETLLRSQKHFQAPLSFSEEEIALFQEFFKLETSIYKGFYYLHLCGFLGAFIPIYRQLLFLPQLDFYHHFTLDEHSLLTLKFISDIHKSKNSLIRDVFYTLACEEKTTLIYTLLLHDVGKIHPGNHIENNKEIIDSILCDLPLSENQKADVSFLVISHLLMSHTVQREDINRIKVILGFASRVKNLRYLNLLFLLTIADIQAVNDTPLASFTESALCSLYIKTKIVLCEGEHITIHSDEKIQIIENLKQDAGHEIKDLLALFPEDYLIETEEQDILNDIKTLESNPGEDIWCSEDQGLIKIRFLGHDRHGILSKIVAGLTLSRLNIVEARVYTLSNARILDYFFCTPIAKDKKFSLNDQKNLRNEISKLLELPNLDNIKTSFHNKLYYWTTKSSLPEIPTEVSLSEQEEKQFYLSVETRDFPGILYFITDFLHQKGFSIQKSKINTIGVRVFDTFYLTTLSKPTFSLDEVQRELARLIRELKDELLEQK